MLLYDSPLAAFSNWIAAPKLLLNRPSSVATVPMEWWWDPPTPLLADGQMSTSRLLGSAVYKSPVWLSEAVEWSIGESKDSRPEIVCFPGVIGRWADLTGC